jgi:peptidoglycan/xylan/chitin deacetylase (PgdA/CDA1 family)
MYFITTPWWLQKIYSSCIWKVHTAENKIYLTFDDGPHPHITPFVLNTLKQYNAKATFFCIGNNVKKYGNVYDHILAEGHSIGNHTFNHINGWHVGNYDYMKEITLAAQLINTNLFRPPYGRISRKQIKLLKADMQVIMWTVLSGDFDVHLSKEKCLQNVIHYTTNGSIVVFHDSKKAFDRLQFALPKTLEYFANKGFSFEALPYKKMEPR